MKKLPELYWIISAVITIAGISVMTAGAAQMNKESAQKITVSDLCTAEELQSVMINIDTADVILQPSADNTVVLEFSDEKRLEYSFKDGVLTVQNKKGIFLSGIHFISFGAVPQKNQIVLSLPEKQYDEFVLSCGTGDMSLSGVNAGMLTASTGTGDITSESCIFSEIDLDSGTGDIDLNQTEISSVSDIDIGTGDFTAESCTFSGITIDDGTGEIKMQNSALTGNADINSGTGDVSLTLSGNIQDYQIDCSECIGDVNIQNNSLKSMGSVSAQYQMKIDTVGSVDILFTE